MRSSGPPASRYSAQAARWKETFDALVVVRGLRPAGLRTGSAAEREQMIANCPDLRLRVAAQLRIVRLGVIRPERRHPRAGQDVRRLLQPIENPIGIEPLRCHA